jgi:hypothetical protein
VLRPEKAEIIDPLAKRAHGFLKVVNQGLEG